MLGWELLCLPCSSTSEAKDPHMLPEPLLVPGQTQTGHTPPGPQGLHGLCPGREGLLYVVGWGG